MILHIIPNLKTGGAERQLLSLVANRKDHHIATLTDYNIFQLINLIYKLKPNVIQGWLYYGDLAAMLALYLSGRRHKTKMFWSVRCSDMDLSNYSWRLRLAVRLCTKLSRFTDGIIANSFAGMRHHLKLGYANKFHVIHNGVDTEKFKPDPYFKNPKIKRIINVGRNDPIKDHRTFLEVAKRLPTMEFSIINGSADYFMSAIFNSADCLLSTSLSEGFPNVIAEAMSCGTPVVATDVGDTAEIVGNTGILVKPKDIDAMVAGILRLINDPEKESRSGAARNQIINNFSIEKARAAYDAVYNPGLSPKTQRLDPSIRRQTVT